MPDELFLKNMKNMKNLLHFSLMKRSANPICVSTVLTEICSRVAISWYFSPSWRLSKNISRRLSGSAEIADAMASDLSSSRK